MPTPPLSDELALAAAQAVVEHGGVAQAARAMGLARNTLDTRFKRAVERGFASPVPSPLKAGYIIGKHNLRYDRDGQLVGQSVHAIKDRPEVYSVREGFEVDKESAYTDGEGRLIGKWTRSSLERRDPLWIAEKLREAMDGYQGRSTDSPAPEGTEDDLATIYPVADTHFGLYAWARETGQDYDLQIAERTNRAAIDDLVRSTQPSSVAVVLGLGDLTHADNSSNKTARSGNALDVDTRYAKVMQTALLFMIYAVDSALQKHGRVIVRNLPGNHDDHTALAITLALWSWYRGNPRVTVDDDPGRFWWWRFGKAFLGATHGDTVKMDKLPLVMAESRAEDWGVSKYRHIFTGHIHHKSAVEMGGVIVESFQSPAARDAWHEAAGYRSGRSLSALVFHKERGEIARHKVNIG